MRAIFIAVGSEMLERNMIDTNSLYVTEKLLDHGILTEMKVVIGDDLYNMSWLIKQAFKRVQLVIITGGLGPTEDDITREATADALKRDLVFREDIVAHIEGMFKKRGMEMPQINTRQAFILDGAEVLDNPIGTAPGQYLDDPQCKVLLLPGPPREMKPIFDKALEEKIAPLSNFFVYKHNFKLADITESETDARVAELYTKFRNVRTTILSSPGIIDLHLMGRSRKTIDDAKKDVEELADKIREEIKDFLVTEADIPLEQVVVQELIERGLTLSVAESCTGGGLGHAVTNVPGSSAIFMGGVIAYSDELKIKLLGVDPYTLKKHGAVSKDTAGEMARGIRERTGSDIAVAITGIAGPGGAKKGKPVGLVFMHLAAEDKEMGFYKIFPGDRDIVKQRTVNCCLSLIKNYLKELPPLPQQTSEPSQPSEPSEPSKPQEPRETLKEQETQETDTTD